MNKKNKVCILMNALFYALLFVLIICMIYPYTSINFRKKLFSSYSYRLNKEEIILKKGETFKLKLFDINKRIKFVSTDFKVANVNINGKITALKAGKAFIKVKVDDKTLKCRVYVIDISNSHVNLCLGESKSLSIKGKRGYIRWSSSNKKVVKVNRKGKVTAKGKGRATVYAKTDGKVLSCRINVN